MALELLPDPNVIARLLICIAAISAAVSAQNAAPPPTVLPAPATIKFATSLDAAAAHPRQVWRDTPPLNEDGTVNAYVEIACGDRRKWEFDMRANERKIDRMIPADVGGYPVNYGFVPQTISYDGDPFDALVLGPPAAAGELVRGAIVGVMFMEDEKGLDSKVVLTPIDRDGRPLHNLDSAVQREIGDYFRRYKQHEAGAFSKVPGWGAAAEGLAFIRTTHAFFEKCRGPAGKPCAISE
jgi:inorganic pyrophosphatase